MALSNLARYDASFRASDDDAALERMGFDWAGANGYDIPYDVAGCVGRLQALGGKRKVYDASRRRQVVQWTAVDEMHRICEPYRREPDPEPEPPAEPEVAPAVEPERKPSGRLGVKVERLLMRQKNEEQQRALRQ
jgi:hypothetical protein